MGKHIVVFSVVATFIILFGGVIFLSNTTSTPQITVSENVKAMVPLTTSDFGSIPMYKGNVSKTFTIKNTGLDTLKLFNVKTSCHCTKASVTIGSEESPLFGMSSVSSWLGEVFPGKEAKLSVIFDPAYHGPTGTGPINRYVSVETNDKTNSKLTFTVTGIVVK